MDRRKLGANKSSLHRPLNSASQTASRSGLDSLKENNVTRSISNDEKLQRKRKNSDEIEDDDDDDPVKVTSPLKPTNTKKKLRVVDDDDDDDDVNDGKAEQKTSPKKPTPGGKTSGFPKPRVTRGSSILRKTAKGNEQDEEDDQSSGNSFIRGMLTAMDRSPSKSSQRSQSSTSSDVDRYRRVNLRTPVQPKDAKKKTTPKKKEKNNVVISDDSSTGISDEEPEMSFSDSDAPLSTRKNKKKVTKEPVATTSTRRESPRKKQASPVHNDRNRVLESPELVVSPLKTFQSPEKVNITRRKKLRNQNHSNDKLVHFLEMNGIYLGSGEDLHTANSDPREVIQKMKENLSSGDIDSGEIIAAWNQYIEDEENLRKSMLELKIETDDGVALCSKAISLSRLLLQVPQLQIEIMNSLFRRLVDAVIASDSSDDAPFALQILQQFRFLETLVDPDILIARIEELLSASPEWFQRETIVFIPDMIADNQHRTTAEMLINIMEKNSDLTNIILDCIHNLILGKEYKEELREKVLSLLQKKFDKSAIPPITRFTLNACSTEAIALKSLNALRVVDMTPSRKEKKDECFTHQSFMISAMKMSILLFKEVAQAAVTMIKAPTEDAVPMDIIILMLLHETTTKKKIVETTLHGHVKDGHYKTSILNILYTGYKEVAKSFQSTALSLAINLLKTDSPGNVEFAVEWLRNIFISQADAPYKQREIMEKLLNLMGTKGKTVKNALEVLCRLADDETERQYLQQHACFLRSFLERIHSLEFDEVATLYHLLHGLCTQSELISNILNDDLSIIMQKQLCSTKVVAKCKGVVGAVMAIKHLSGSGETSNQAFLLLKKTVSSLKSCIRSQALFYDQLEQVIANSSNVSDDFLSKITIYFEDIFVSSCLVETSPTENLVPKFGLNDPDMAESYNVSFGSGKTGAFVPVFFKLLRTCNLRLNNSLESINAVLGCSVLMPDDLDLPEPSTADYVIHCINWFRELIGGFVTQTETLLREQVLKRLESLMTLQGEYAVMVSMSENRQMDTKIINLLVADSTESSSETVQHLTTAQACFIVKELLGIFENQASESFIRDLIKHLPKVCIKLKEVIDELRKNDDPHEREAVRLFLALLVSIFNWKELGTAKYSTLLRDGLRALASLESETSANLRTCKDLVSAAYKYFESLADIATHISLAVALVDMCGSIMKHSNSFSEASKDRQAKMAHGFLCLEWSDSHGAQFKAAVKSLLNSWLDNEPDPLTTVSSVLEWLPDGVLSLSKAQSPLDRMPAVTKVNFHLLYKQIFVGLVKGIEISLEAADRDPDRIRAWLNAAQCLEGMTKICKRSKSTIYLALYLRYSTLLYQSLLNFGMKLLEANIKYQTEEVMTIIKLFQESGRFLRSVFVTARKEKNVTLLKLIPFAKSKREKFIWRVKGMLTANNGIQSFWMGNLLNKDLDGEQIDDDDESGDLSVVSDAANDDNSVADVESEIFNSNSDEEMDVDVE
ncbi:hypothetical protein QAD02_012190 [Eretmocerus hayati]|uniref:Uncharacterized protein n=1 Tax=Eretmocerus hayati TaxID=131215 RepID=A0ACC2NYW8_9HYME|nr:hypothetical protein QAD02_012190 [Eretmocerus hayati]